MKNSKILVVLLAVALVVALTVVGFVVNAEEVVTIATAEEYNTKMADSANLGKTIELTANIDFTGVEGGNVEAGTFTGTFDGKGYTISGINKPLFAQLNGTVQNLTIDGKIVKEDRDIGSLAEKADNNFVVKNVVSKVDMEITTRDNNVGGVIGYPKNGGTFENVTYSGNTVLYWFDAAGDWGAMAGYINNNGSKETKVINCVFDGSVTIKAIKYEGTAFGSGYTGKSPANGVRSAVGGFLGNTKKGTMTLTNCLNLGTVTFDKGEYTPATYASGLVGFNQAGSDAATINVTNCVDLSTVNGADTVTTTGLATGTAVSATNGYYTAADATETVVREGATYMTFAEGVYVNVTAGKFVDEIPAAPVTTAAPETTAAPAVTEAPETPVDPETAGFSTGIITEVADGKYTVASEDFSAFISAKRNIVGGKSDLRIVLVANYNAICDNDDAVLTVKIGGKTIVKNVIDDLHVYQSAVAAGETYTAADGSVLFGFILSNVPNDAWDTVEVTLTGADIAVAGSAAQENVITYATGAPVPGGFRIAYGQIEGHHNGTNYTASAIFWADDPVRTEMANKVYDVKILYNGVLSDVSAYEVSGSLVRLSLEPAITGIVKGGTYTFELQLFNADGDIAYYSGMLTATADCYSTDMEQKIDLPTTGIKELKVSAYDKTGIGVWNQNTENVAQLFDNNTSTTKMGGNVQSDADGALLPVTVTFSFAEPTTLAYYTIYTGNDTDTGSGRNPKSWVLYAKVGEDWVAISEGIEGKTGIVAKRSTPFSYEVTTAVEAQDYKIEFVASGSQFQLNELKFYTKDASVTAPTAAAIIENADAEVVLIHRNDWLKNEEGTATFGLATKGDGSYIGGEAGLKTILDKPAYVYIKDVTAGGEYVKYNVINMTTARHCDIRFDAEGFVPVEGHVYDIVLLVEIGAGNRYPAGTIYAIPSWGFQLGLAAKNF